MSLPEYALQRLVDDVAVALLLDPEQRRRALQLLWSEHEPVDRHHLVLVALEELDLARLVVETLEDADRVQDEVVAAMRLAPVVDQREGQILDRPASPAPL